MMKKSILLLASIALVATSALAGTYCHTTGNATYCDDGTTYYRYGNRIQSSKGDSWTRFGSHIYGSDGSWYASHGDTTTSWTPRGTAPDPLDAWIVPESLFDDEDCEE